MPLEDIDERSLTPMMKHWLHIKKKYPEHLIAYRLGDFFEFFHDDAVRVSNLLGITLTKRKAGEEPYPLAGIPYHAGSYLNNLVNMGQTVVIVDQLEDPSTVKGRIVKRGVIKILSPGTITDYDMLKSSENNYVASMVKEKKGYGIAFADLSTGEFVTTAFSSKIEDPLEKVLSIFYQYDPVELIIPSELKKDEKLFILVSDLTGGIIKPYSDFVFNYEESCNIILHHFNITNLQPFGLEGIEKELAVQAAGGLLAFLKETQRDMIPNIFRINLIQEKGILHLDYVTQRNLELISSLWEKGKETSLYSVFNHTHTPMGARLLKKILLQPLTDLDEINYRLNVVQKFKDDIFLRSDLREELKIIGDLERFINRITYSTRVNARDLLNIKNSLDKIPKIKNLLRKAQIPEISRFLDKIDDFENLRSLIERSIKEDAPLTIKEGNIIKEGFDHRIDELRDIINNGKNYVLEYEESQKKRFNLTSGLKVAYNNIIGYYVQITLNTLKSISKIPEDYIERSTIKNAKRFTTEELKILEDKIVSAEEKINELEYEIFTSIREDVIKEAKKVLETAVNIAMIDVLACFAEISEKFNYCRPMLNNDTKIIIKEGRHPVIEQINITESFIPNDCYLDTESEQILIITGPNMAGKSTYLRQTALICLIAQMGCFIPAKSATIGIIDQIFTRIGASDDLARKLSTFMIEMTETAKILNYATPNSLIIIDELGRGTSTSDGQSIAMSVLQKLHELKIKTLFSTHYHQLTEINLPRIKNYHLNIIENEDGSINFVRKLQLGSTDKSYGIHIAKLAGIPDDVIIRAFEILEQIEAKDPFKTAVRDNGNSKTSEKIHDKIIHGKKRELERLSSEIKSITEQFKKCDEELATKERELENKKVEMENLKEKIKNIQETTPYKKKIVQTSLFPPLKKEKVMEEDIEKFLNTIKQMNIDKITPMEAMKKLIELKEKLIEMKL